MILYEVFTTFRQIHTHGSAMLYLALVVPPAEQLAGFSPRRAGAIVGKDGVTAI